MKKSPTILQVIEIFCKSRETVNTKISVLYEQFKNFVESRNLKISHSSSEFELALFFLRKKVVDRVKDKCLKYVEQYGSEAYDLFIKNEDNISYYFWVEMLKKEGMQWPPPERDQNIFLGKKPEKSPEQEKKEFDDKRIVEFKSALPIDWADMPFPKRVDFAKNIQHADFKEYVLNLDSKLKTYFKNAVTKKSSGLKLYVTLFSFQSDTTTPEAKILLKRFVEQLNLLGRSRLQYVECSNPPMVEIREVR